MIRGIGTDIIELTRIEKVNREDRLAHRILSHRELDKYLSITDAARKVEYLAGRFAVKEAYSKALGSGIGRTIAFKEVSCINQPNGKPSIEDDLNAHVSISHSKEYAIAMVVLEAE